MSRADTIFREAIDEENAPPSLLNSLPGGSLILRLPGSGLLLRGENLVRGIVADGLRWAIGSSAGDADADTDADTDHDHNVDSSYNELRSAVQELVDMFDFDSREITSDNDSANGIDLLRATKHRVCTLEQQLRAEQQARKAAELRIAELERADAERRHRTQIAVALNDEDLAREREMCEELKTRLRGICESDASWTSDVDSSDGNGEEMLERLHSELDRERQMRDRAEMKLNLMREIQQEMLMDQSARNRAEWKLQQLNGELGNSKS